MPAVHWPQLTVQVRFRGAFAYVDGHVGDDEPFPLCRLRYSGSASIWGFALYLYSSGKCEEQILPTGGFAGSPEEALDCACGLYLSAPASGIRDLVRRLAAKDAGVVATDLDEAAGRALAESCGSPVRFVRHSVTRRQE